MTGSATYSQVTYTFTVPISIGLLLYKDCFGTIINQSVYHLAPTLLSPAIFCNSHGNASYTHTHTHTQKCAWTDKFNGSI